MNRRTTGYWAACAFLLLFLIANFPRPQPESVGWLALAGVCLLGARSRAGWGSTLRRLLWDDPGMRWHLLAAATGSVVGFLSVGLSGFVPVAFTVVVRHPLTPRSSLLAWDAAPLGDNGWPFYLVSGFLWPWAFPFAHWLGKNRKVRYALLVAFWMIGQTVVLSLLFFQRVPI